MTFEVENGITRFELDVIISGMDRNKLDKLYEFLDDNSYDYVGRENMYDLEEEE